MIDLISDYLKTKGLSYLCLITPIVIETISTANFPTLNTIHISLFAAISILLLLPLRADDTKQAFIKASILAICFLIMIIAKVKMEIIIIVLSLFVIVCLINDTRLTFAFFSQYLKRQSLNYFLESQMRLTYSLVLCFLGHILHISRVSKWVCIPLLLVLIAFFIIIIISTLSGRHILLSVKQEKEFRHFFSNKFFFVVEEKKPRKQTTKMTGEDMEKFAKELLKLIEEQELFLDKSLTMQTFSQKVLSNRTYISKAINEVLGTNFNRLINKYRVEYSIKVIEKDPMLTVDQVAERSGFNNAGSFRNSFTPIVGVNPKEYIASVKYKLLTPLPLSSRVGEPP